MNCRPALLCVTLSVAIGLSARESRGADPTPTTKTLSTTERLINAYVQRFQNPASVRASNQPFIEPENQYGGVNGLQFELRLGFIEQVIPADPVNHLAAQRLRLRCYNGRMIGPTIRIRPGNKFCILVRNELPVEQPEDTCDYLPPGGIDTPHGWNCTNLHTHGLHISPTGHSDNVFVEIPPKKNCRFEYQLPADHVSGTFWYHPHKHGSVALQVTTGAAGALIVEGTGLDLIPEIHKAFERIMVFQQLQFTPNPNIVVTPLPSDVYNAPPNIQPITLINGQTHPVLRIAPGSVERWRIVHAGLRSPLKLAVFKDDTPAITNPALRTYVPLHEIAIDGIPRGKMTDFADPSAANYPLIYPGYRWDVLFKAPDKLGTYFLVDLERPATEQLRAGEPASPLNYLARVEIVGPPCPMSLPNGVDLAAAVPCQFRPISKDEIKDKHGKPRVCALNLAVGGGKFTIDQCEYDPDRIDRVAWLNTAEEWHVSGSGGGHPFHMHVNPFEQIVTDKNGKSIDYIWRDTLFVQGPPSTIRIRFRDFAGETVLHCHILDHEDQGMMENLMILPENQPLGNLPLRVKCSDQLVQQCAQTQPLPPATPMPCFSLLDANGKTHSSREFAGKPLLVVFFRGFACPHCAVQLQRLAALEPDLRRRHISVVAISTDGQADLSTSMKNYALDKQFPFLILADDSFAAFKAFHCWNGYPLHGLLLFDPAGRVISARTGSAPFVDFNTILKEFDTHCRPALTARAAN
jgi:FtsP/CotA-like multicopper oxidase with cupredoxin domain/peroxiredoxin